VSVSLRDVVEAILDRHSRPGAKKTSEPFKLGILFFPVPRSENKAVRYFPQWFRREGGKS